MTKQLMTFQQQGVENLIERFKSQQFLLLADEQGLGKTVQALKVGQALGRKMVVICPATMKLCWLNEAKAWGIEKSVLLEKTSSLTENLYITNYERLAKHLDQIKSLGEIFLVFDELHYLKNNKAMRTRLSLDPVGVAENAYRILGLTGTPIPNSPIEIWSWVSRFASHVLDVNSYLAFCYKYCNAYKRTIGAKVILETHGASNVEGLYRCLSPIMLRRLKKDVLTELPPKSFSLVELRASREAKKLLKLEAEQDEVKQFYQKLNDANDVSVPSFAQYSALRQQLGVEKAKAAVDYLKDLLDGDVKKLVLFCAHREVITLLEAALKGYGVAILQGGMSDKEKWKSVEDFQTKEDVRVFIGNYRAAGIGITLTAAQYIVLVESTTVPGELYQAVDRCHRTGQKGHVHVDLLVYHKSFDHALYERCFLKQKNILSILDNHKSYGIINPTEENDMKKAEIVELVENTLKKYFAREEGKKDIAEKVITKAEKVITKEELSARAAEYVDVLGVAPLIAHLKTFNATKISMVDPKDYARLYNVLHIF